MKKFALALMAASAALFGFGLVASAQSYTPVAVPPTNVTPGSGYTVSYVNCVPGETITFTQAQSTPTSVTGVCSGAVASAIGGSIIGLLLPQQAGLPTATGTFTAGPTGPGTFNGTAVGTQSPSVSFAFTIPAQVTPTTVAPPATAAPPIAGGLPATGSEGLATTTMVALGLLAVGGGLFVVAQVRRRQVPTA